MAIPENIRGRLHNFVQIILAKIGVNIKFSQHSLKKIDDHVREHGYGSRSEFILEAINSKLDASATEKLIEQFLESPKGQELVIKAYEKKYEKVNQ